MSALLEANPDYQAVTVMVVDWDKHSGSDITKKLGVTNRATLVMLKGGQELGRVSWSAKKEAIEPLFQAAISG